MEPLISIVIPAYNAEAFIERTIGSVKLQSYTNWEILIVDDGSKDNTGSLIDDIACSHVRIHAFHQVNGGEISARRTGVLNAKGDWIMFLDADDVLPETALESLLKSNRNVDIIVGTMHVLVLSKDNAVIEDYVWQNKVIGCLGPEEFAIGLFMYNVQMAAWAKLYRRSLFKDFDWCLDREIRQNPDLLFNIGIGAKAHGIYVTNDAVCYDYIIHSGSASTSGLMPFDGWCRLFNQARKYIQTYKSPALLEEAFFHYRMERFDGMMRHGIINQPRDNAHVKDLLCQAGRYVLNSDEKKIYYLLKYPILRRIFHAWQVIKTKNV